MSAWFGGQVRCGLGSGEVRCGEVPCCVVLLHVLNG